MAERTPGAIHKSDRADAAARRMRRDMTYGEAKLWKVLRRTDLHFRRQAPIGPYVVDFVSHSARLIIEIDGGIHNLPAVAARDAQREAWLTGRGYTVMRISDNQTSSDPHSVVQAILDGISVRTPTPSPSPQGGGGL